MPNYPLNKTYTCGFYNSKIVNGEPNRKYTAENMNEPYRGIFSDGVKPNDNGTLGADLQVIATDGMGIKVSAGRGQFAGRYFVNLSDFNITLDESTNTIRYDCIIIKADATSDVSFTDIYIKSLSHVPTNSDLIRTDLIKEYCIAYIKINSLISSITQANITDTRTNNNLCGLICGVFNQFDTEALTAQWNTQFNEWFEDIKDEFISGATLTRIYFGTYTSVSVLQTHIPITVSQYNKNIDVLIVLVEGRTFIENVDYTISDAPNGDTYKYYIDLTIGLPLVGAKVAFQVLKSVDGTNAETVISEVVALRNEIDVLNDKARYTFVATGSNDNIRLSNLCQNILNDASISNTAQIVIDVIGNSFGVSLPSSGAGTSVQPFKYFNIGKTTTQTKKITIDFSRCAQIPINVSNTAAYATIFSGYDINIINPNIVVQNVAVVNGFDGEKINCEGANINISAEQSVVWGKDGAVYGNYKQNRVSITSKNNNAFAFHASAGGLMRVIDCEAYAYTTNSSAQSAAILVAASQINTCLIAERNNFPLKARSGYIQSSIIKINSGFFSLCGNAVGKTSELYSTTTGHSNVGEMVISKI